MRETFYAFWDRVTALYPDSDIDVRGDAVHLKENGRTYCWAWAPLNGNGTYPDNSLVISVGTSCRPVPPKGTRIVRTGIDRWMYHMPVSGRDGVTGELMRAVGMARCEKLGCFLRGPGERSHVCGPEHSAHRSSRRCPLGRNLAFLRHGR